MPVRTHRIDWSSMGTSSFTYVAVDVKLLCVRAPRGQAAL